jgi:hypothetical protein
LLMMLLLLLFVIAVCLLSNLFIKLVLFL